MYKHIYWFYLKLHHLSIAIFSEFSFTHLFTRAAFTEPLVSVSTRLKAMGLTETHMRGAGTWQLWGICHTCRHLRGLRGRAESSHSNLQHLQWMTSVQLTQLSLATPRPAGTGLQGRQGADTAGTASRGLLAELKPCPAFLLCTHPCKVIQESPGRRHRVGHGHQVQEA